MELLTTLTFEMWSALAQSLIFGVVLTIAVRIALGMVAPANASTRFVVWFVTLIVIAILPAAFLVRSTLPRLTNVTESKVAPVRRPAVTRAVVAAQPIVARTVAPPSAEPANPFQAQLPMHIDVASGLLGIYVFAVAGLLFGRLGFSYIRLRRLKARTSIAPPEVRERFEMWLSLCRTSRPVRLLISAGARSPMAVGFKQPAVIIPDSLLLRLTGAELDHLGLHELAHIRRYDDWTNLVQRIIQAMFFFHPAIHWICRRLEFEREVACDDWVLTLTGAAKPYARSLTKVLEHSPWRCGPVLASGAVFRKRQIIRRIEMMLDGARDSRPRVSAVTVVAILLCLFGAASQIIQLPALIAFVNDPGGDRYRSSWTVDGRRIETDIRGEIQFGDDDISVQSISPGGYLKIREKGWSWKELEIVPNDALRPGVRYLVDGKERPYDDKAREWAQNILALAIRENAFNAEERALRILGKRGASSVFEEIDRIQSSHSRQKYLSAVIRSGKLNEDELRRAVQRARRIPSDHDKSNLLLEVANHYTSEPLRAAYFDAIGTINSDHDRRRVLTRILEDAGSDAAILARAGRSVEQMSSDHDKSELLRLPAMRAAAGDPAARRALMQALKSIQSDHDKSRAISEILSAGTLPPDGLEDLLRVAAGIQSDHDKSKVLELALRQEPVQPEAQSAFFAAAGTIQTESDRGRVLKTMIERDIAWADFDEMARSIEHISGDNEKANLLVKMASKPATPAFLKAVSSINSDNDMRRVIEAMVERGGTADSAKNAVMLAANIGSDNDKAQVLAAVAEKYRNDPEVRAALRKAAEKISSDSDYRRIVSKLNVESGEAEK